ncbi:hypothetical protein [Tabrizicola sp.]|uniref:hypothetical protein n=1 Tax=Tabrizicola sp. TaxID=2005166 RepID=UPI003F30B45A
MTVPITTDHFQVASFGTGYICIDTGGSTGDVFMRLRNHTLNETRFVVSAIALRRHCSQSDAPEKPALTNCWQQRGLK